MAGTVGELWRYPVKSMLGESISSCEVGQYGLAGDRAFALIDAEDGKVASAKNPRKWGALLQCRAEWDGGVAVMTLPGGETVRSDDPDVDTILSKAIGRECTLASIAPKERTFEEVWPSDIEGLAPEHLIEGTKVGEEGGESLSAFPLGSFTPEGTFFDLSLLHLLTTSTLARLRELAPGSVFDVRRYRPNVLVESDAAEPAFVENDWVGKQVAIGESLVASVSVPTMRCVMTTLAQEDLPRDRGTLKTIAEHNRLEIEGWGTWACAGVYADLVTPGTIRVGDTITVV